MHTRKSPPRGQESPPGYRFASTPLDIKYSYVRRCILNITTAGNSWGSNSASFTVYIFYYYLIELMLVFLNIVCGEDLCYSRNPHKITFVYMNPEDEI